MKLSPGVLATWREPASYAYGSSIGAIWPKVLPLSGSLVELCEDRIARSNARYYTYIAFSILDECIVSIRRYSEDQVVYVLTFKSDKVSLLRFFLGYLKETACDDLGTVNRVIHCLRDKGIVVRDERA